MKKIKFFTLLMIAGLLFISLTPSESVSRPAYALSETDSFITENNYELFFEDESTVGTIDTYTQMWIKPSDCYPIDFGTPPCTGAFAVEYNADSDTQQYDQEYYDIIKTGLIGVYPGFSDITEEVPGAELAVVYSPIPGVYAAIAYFGIQTGVFVVVAEVDTAGLSPENSYIKNANYDESGMSEIVVEIGDKIASELNLPGFSTIITIGALVSLLAIVHLIRRKR